MKYDIYSYIYKEQLIFIKFLQIKKLYIYSIATDTLENYKVLLPSFFACLKLEFKILIKLKKTHCKVNKTVALRRS